jgi:hypothetical protein
VWRESSDLSAVSRLQRHTHALCPDLTSYSEQERAAEDIEFMCRRMAVYRLVQSCLLTGGVKSLMSEALETGQGSLFLSLC